MGFFDRLRSLFGGAAETAGYPAIGGAFRGRASAGSYMDYVGSSGYHYDGAKWQHGLGSSGRGPVIDHARMRANARSAVHDSPVARAIVDRYEQTVVDTGVRLNAEPNADILGITQEQAERWSADVESRFHLWATSKLATAAEDMSFYQAQRFTMRSRKRDGEYFVRCYYDPRRDLLNPLRIGFIDPNQIMGDLSTNTGWPAGGQDGITRDDQGREIEYSVMVQKADGSAEYVKIPARSKRSGLPIMLHGYAPQYAGQKRGFSEIGHALQEFENLTDFTAAQIKKAIVQSSISMYVKPPADAPAITPFTDMISGPASKYDAPNSDNSETITDFDLVNYSRINDVNLRPGSVGVFNLQEGGDLLPFKDSAPSESFSSFVEAFVCHLAASVNMPPEILTLKFSQNYSASRAALILFWRTACIERDEEGSDFYSPIYRAWLAGEIAAGRITAPGWSDPRMRAAWCSCTWNGPPMPNIDPAKTAKADKDYIEMGAQTPDMVALNLNGSSGAANRAKNKRQIAQLTPVPWAAKRTTTTSSSMVEEPDLTDSDTDEEPEGDDAEEMEI